jgi:crotonobetainyl-CoA:carnitine CoA-transferase CaiB-like acyl-CoA transferase
MSGPLAGYRVLELCSTIAGPVCARLLADFGAEVIKVEPPGGDPVRSMGYHDGDISLYAATILRNKQAVTVDMKTAQGRDLVRRLAAQCDAVVENFRPGTLERLGLGYDVLSADNPGLVLVRISGYGQTGPYRAKPGYGAICEAFGGVRHLTGDPDRPPARVALATTDYLTATFAAFGAVMALLERSKTGLGQVVDTALYETAFSMMEAIVPAYDRLKLVPTRQGSRLPSMAPNNLYLARDGSYILIAANNDKVFGQLARAMGQPELQHDPRFATIRARSANMDATDAAVAAWVAGRDGPEVETLLEDAGVPVSRVFTVADIFADPHYAAREMLLRMPHPRLGSVTVPGIVPKLSRTPGAVRHVGPEPGADTRDVLTRLLGLSAAELAQLEQEGVIGAAAPAATPTQCPT